jgi:hypothetical protein
MLSNQHRRVPYKGRELLSVDASTMSNQQAGPRSLEPNGLGREGSCCPGAKDGYGRYSDASEDSSLRMCNRHYWIVDEGELVGNGRPRSVSISTCVDQKTAGRLLVYGKNKS